MVKQLLDKGYTLIEMLLVLFIISLMVITLTPVLKRDINKQLNLIINEIAMTQYKAIIECEKLDYNNYNCDIYFNRHGGINQANTYGLYDDLEIIVSLGTGRIYEKTKR